MSHSNGKPATSASAASGDDFQQIGQTVRPQPAQEATFVASVTEFVHEVIPQQSAVAADGSVPLSNLPSSRTDCERIDWVSFQTADINDRRWSHCLKKINDTSDGPVIVVFGLARGYQIWALQANGDCLELVSDRQGPIRSAVLLPSPESGFNDETEKSDEFDESRPLIALIDSICSVPQRRYCTVGIVSLISGNQVKALRFEEPVFALWTNSKAFVVQFMAKLIVFDSLTFTQQFVINGCFKTDDQFSGTPVALGNPWMAYVDTKLNPNYQACGGISSNDQFPSYTKQVISAAKTIGKTVSAFGESMVSSLSGSPYFKQPLTGSSQSSPQTHCVTPGIVTVVDLDLFDKTKENIHSCYYTEGVIAHFVAHLDEPCVYLNFGNCGAIILTAGQSGQKFHLFSLLPHPGSARLGAVHHLYTLYRGNTPAKVVSSTFSSDNRWLAVATNHGTAHVFPITPYGGAINMRTHAGKVVNRESRYHRSAGLDAIEQGLDCTGISPVTSAASPRASNSESPVGSASGSSGVQSGCGTRRGHRESLVKDTHPCVASSGRSPLMRAIINPRLPPYPLALILHAVAKIRQRYLSAEDLSAWAVDMAPVSLSSSGHPIKPSSSSTIRTEFHRVAVTFANRHASAFNKSGRVQNALFIVSNEGVLSEYQFQVKPRPDVQSSNAKVTSDTPIQLQVDPVAQWNLFRTKSSPDLRPPLSQSNPLVASADAVRNYKQKIDDQQEDQLVHRSSAERDSVNNEESPSWVSQVEMVTYGGPHRRLWMGPQFTFRTYADSPTHSTADLVSPSAENIRASSSPICTPSRSVPVVIEATSVGGFDFDQDINRMTRATREVCGSWSDNDYISCDEQESRLRETIADAMREAPHKQLSFQDTTVKCAAAIFSFDSNDADCDDPNCMEDARSDFSERSSRESLQFANMDS